MIIHYFPKDKGLLKPSSKFERGKREEIVELAFEMATLMAERNGVGIAGPQVGVNERIFVISRAVLGDKCKHTVFINPEIIWRSPDLDIINEGCLSIPGETFEVPRPVEVSIKATNINGESFSIDKINGFLGRVLQHEFDHLEGLLINRFDPGK